jgi:carboxypeptidase family protein
MNRIVVCVFGVVLIQVLLCSMVFAQATAQISGVVKDQSGAVLPGVEITATQTDTGVARMTVTNETGSYVLASLSLGPYRLEAALPGFRTFVQRGLVLEVNSSPVINATLEVGQITEQVEVQANAAQVETRNVGVGSVIENERILELPLNGRQVTDLIKYAGASVEVPINPTWSDLSTPGFASIAVGGGFTSATVYSLDGAVHNDFFNNLNLPLPFPDALQEFKVETSALAAASGTFSGAKVSSVTKSGTNALHGDLFEFVRNDLFNARQYFATKNSTLKRNQFGGTLGGPIMKNKLFFFGGYQGTTVRQDPANQVGFVPTTAMLAGDFTAYASPACNGGRQITLSAPFVNNRTDPSRLSPAALKFASHLPPAIDPCGRVIYGETDQINQGQYVGRIDYQRSDKQTIFGRYLASSYTQPVPYSIDNNLLNTFNGQGFDNLAQSYTFGDTYLVGQNMVNSFRLALDRTAVGREDAVFFSGPDIGINMFTYYPHRMVVMAPGSFTIGGTIGPNRGTVYQAIDDISLLHGQHQFSFGASAVYGRRNLVADQFSIGRWTFSGQATGLVLSDLLAGMPSSFNQAPDNSQRVSQMFLGLYVADTWKAKPRLTVSYGLRWEPGFPYTTRDGQMDSFDETRYANGVHSTVFSNAPYGFYYPGDPGFLAKCRSSGVCSADDTQTRWKNVSPRVGLAWDPNGDGRTSIRSSYSMAYDIRASAFYVGSITPPWVSQVTLPFPAGGFDNPWLGYPGGNPFPVPTVNKNQAFPSFATYFAVNPNSPTTTRNSWNLSLERQVATNWLASATYIGTSSTHVWLSRNLNLGVFIPGGPCTLQGVTFPTCSTAANVNQRRRLALTYPNIGGTPIGTLTQYSTGGTGNYNALLLVLQRRAAKGVTLTGNYTWSHCIIDGSADQLASLTDPNNRRLDRGNCSSDVRQIFNMTTVASTPQFSNSMLRAVATGWKVSGIFRATTGNFLTVTAGTDRQLSGAANQRPLQVLGNAYGDKSLTKYLNPAAFALPALGTLSSMGKANIQGPGNWDLDMAVSRIFQVRERQRLEARVEAFNVTNSLRVGNPVTALNNGSFGQITSAFDPRILEFALKFVF